MSFVKPNILISACINYDKCRHDGEMISNKFLESLKPFVNFKKVCPEVSIGLGIPRETIRIVKQEDELKLLENNTGTDYTDKMNKFTKKYLTKISNPHGFVFKTKSPTCGVSDARVYPSIGKVSALEKTSGLFSRRIIDEYENYPVIDDGRINDYSIREHFLSRIFLLAEFDEMVKQKSLQKFQEFNHKHKMLFLSFSTVGQNKLGQIVANTTKKDMNSKFKLYREKLIEVTSQIPDTKSKVNVFFHTLGQLSDKMTSKEKKFLLDTLEEYREQKIPFSTLTYLLKMYAIQYDNKKVLNQSFLEPFPKDLINVRDSGKKI